MSASLDNIVDIEVEFSTPNIIRSSFNLGLIIGESDVFEADVRTKTYQKSTYSSAMVADGFTSSSAEYVAVKNFFSQKNSPSQVVVGTKKNVGEEDEETDVEAFIACVKDAPDAYVVCFAYSVLDASIASIASTIDSSEDRIQFVFTTNDANVLVEDTSNILKTLKNANYTRCIGFYYSDVLFSSAICGVICSLNTMRENSAYTLAYKEVTGFTPVDLSQAQLTTLVGYNGNAYCTFGNEYKYIYPGIMSSGIHVDEMYDIDVIYYLIRQYALNSVVSQRVVPQTESGISSIISYISSACEQLREIGIINPGVWTGEDVLDLETGDAIPAGYFIQSTSISEQSAEDRAARKTPPIYVAVKLSGAIEHVVVRVSVNQ